MNIKHRLDETISKWNLLENPFYRAWNDGTLPQDALRTYAGEYGALISLMPSGWETLEDHEIAQEEREHLELWNEFAQCLGTEAGEARLAQVRTLVETAQRLFSDPTTALGALYAFESQQPATAQSKLEGLKAFYNLPHTVEPYFEIHSHNQHESEKLLDR
ncbi:MAG: iron-containing redox enzyme family protein, partial [Candidatus Poribacteria bacterium]|nr:iron-containing redox enzyme family protein [Candidatus Poribacteria bacterium]